MNHQPHARRAHLHAVKSPPYQSHMPQLQSKVIPLYPARRRARVKKELWHALAIAFGVGALWAGLDIESEGWAIVGSLVCAFAASMSYSAGSRYVEGGGASR